MCLDFRRGDAVQSLDEDFLVSPSIDLLGSWHHAHFLPKYYFVQLTHRLLEVVENHLWISIFGIMDNHFGKEGVLHNRLKIPVHSLNKTLTTINNISIQYSTYILLHK